jgi:hypothetical protein
MMGMPAANAGEHTRRAGDAPRSRAKTARNSNGAFEIDKFSGFPFRFVQ